MKKLLFLILLASHSCFLFAQDTFPFNGIRPKDVSAYALTNATIYSTPEIKLEGATVIVEKGKIISVGKNIPIPKHCAIIDASGKFIYAGFIDAFSTYGIPKKQNDNHGEETEETGKSILGWNAAIHPEYNASLQVQHNDDDATSYRNAGITAVCAHKADGISRGTGALIALGNEIHADVIRAEAAAYFSFNKGSSPQQYPSSIMGSIALLRQTYCDASWYANLKESVETNLSLRAMNVNSNLAQIFEANDKWNILRADAIGDEFGVQYLFKTGGNEYQRIEEMKATKGKFIVPVNYPQAFDVSDPASNRYISTAELKHWELAPFNLAYLNNAGIEFCITSSGLEDKSQLLENIRIAVNNGLPASVALAALTTRPAQYMNAQHRVGSILAGYDANFIITNKELFTSESKVLETWVNGKPYFVSSADAISLEGAYAISVLGANIKAESKKGKGEEIIVSSKLKTTEELKTLHEALGSNSKDSTLVQLKLQLKDGFPVGEIMLDSTAFTRVSGNIHSTEKELVLDLVTFGKLPFSMRATVTSFPKKEEVKKGEKTKSLPGEIIYPFTAYGRTSLPQQENVVFRNATLWTCENGKIQEGDLWVKSGKIAGVGVDLVIPKGEVVKEIDATGKHISPGIIDEHSHIALSSVNEGTQASSAEVEEGSVIYPEDIDIYRQLSGGTTASQLLHGSANPIGGQSALVKLRWGANAEGMKIENAPGFIKFALGENVKQSNWGDRAVTRFPQTRMGVEQVYYDHFYRALEYGKTWENYYAACKKVKKGLPMPSAPRRDLELETILEILRKERFITCHSYVQSEINMLMHVADSFNFKINTFTHILEGYKVADKMKAHGAGASTFSDWWAYKAEVKDAIPYNAAVMYEQGITVAINSDDAEMGARLNQEAGKIVKYGSVPEEEALKMVTLNPAKLLHLDDRMGSLKVGKDADFVVWNNEPLSIYARAEKTYIDGACYFNLEDDEKARVAFASERERIIQKMEEAKNGGASTRKPQPKNPFHFHCDSMDETSKGIFIKE
ncbi:MAG: amidohydrolase family protein [Bacteroidota bacterium]|jgi:imidazolonepropionase-like amidohydrolase